MCKKEAMKLLENISCPPEGIFLIVKSEKNVDDYTLIVFYENEFYSFEIIYVYALSIFLARSLFFKLKS